MPRKAPVFVRAHGDAWRWKCRQRWCHRCGDYRNHPDAVAAAAAHAAEHARFGFGGQP